MEADEAAFVVKRRIGIDHELAAAGTARHRALRRDGAAVRHPGQQGHGAVGFLEQAEQARQRAAQQRARIAAEQRGERGRDVDEVETGIDVEFVGRLFRGAGVLIVNAIDRGKPRGRHRPRHPPLDGEQDIVFPRVSAHEQVEIMMTVGSDHAARQGHA